ncbi:MAG: DUF4430 domain-containing protein [Oscillospiraceae bacterium]|nr:DUF4430 domain-containing protein [Oscillospiraceae bacterium]
MNRPLALVLAVVLCLSLFTISSDAALTGKTVTIRHNIDVSGFLQTEHLITSGFTPGIGTFDIDDAQTSNYRIRDYWRNFSNAGHVLKSINIASNGQIVTVNIPLYELTAADLLSVELANTENGLGLTGTNFRVVAGYLSIGVGIGMQNVKASDDVTVTFMWEDDTEPNHTFTAAASANGTINSQFMENTGDAAVYRLQAAPDANYMLDYWECTEGSGTYGNGAVFDSSTNNKIEAPDDYLYIDTLAVTLTENSAFKAHFKPAKIILLDGVAICPYEADWEDAVSISGSGDVGINSPVRVGNRAQLSFRFKTPGGLSDTVNGVNVGVELYKGASAESGDKFFSGSFGSTSLDSSGGNLYFVVHVPSMQQMDGFAAVVTLNGGEAVSRYYPLESGLIVDDVLEAERARAQTGLDAVLEYCKASQNYASVKRLVGITYASAAETIKTAETAEEITAAVNDAIRLMTALISGASEQGIITVAVSVDKLTVSGEYIVEPTLMRLPAGTNGMNVLLALLETFYPEVEEPYRLKGGYLEGIWDPAYTNESGSYKYPGYLSEFDESAGAGWMYSVNNVFPGVGAGAYVLADGDVMRWRYTGGQNSNGVGLQDTANKDALTRKVAEINSAGTQGSYGAKYAAAMSALQKYTASQSEVNAALAAFYPTDMGGRDIHSGYGGTVVLSDEKGNYTVTATAAGYVINAIWVDGVKLADTSGKTTYTTKTAPVKSIFASFIYAPGG